MITVAEAEHIIQSQLKNYGIETVPLQSALGRVLAEDIKADRDIPPFNRSTMDGIAINFTAFEKGVYSYKIVATQAAGDMPTDINTGAECVEIMTGAALPQSTDTVVRFEDLEIKNSVAAILINEINKGQNIHPKGKDKKQNEVIAKANQIITPAIIGIAASVGQINLQVRKLPEVVIISTGDELVEADETPNPYQIRRSNNYMLQAILRQYHVNADLLNVPDNEEMLRQKFEECLHRYDLLLLTGGVSMGKYDYVPQVLENLQVEKLFHKVKQRPGKPFWFGVYQNKVLVFAFPGNPVSSFMCMHRYFLPWLMASAGLLPEEEYAILNKEVTFTPALQYFLQVQLRMNEKSELLAMPVEGNGSGDFANLTDANAFIELPPERDNFKKGEVFRVWRFG